MKRSVAIKKLQDYIAAQNQDFNIAEDVLDFLEKEIGMLPPETMKETVSHKIDSIDGTNFTVGNSYELKLVNEWEK